MDQSILLLGAVAYDPKVITIWDGFAAYFREHGLAFDYILYTNYERQVEAQIAGQIHVAWNSPLAWLECERLARRAGRRVDALAMRDTDRDLTSLILVRDNADIRTVAGLKGMHVAVGARDSPQATLIPLCVLSHHGLEPGRDFEIVEYDLLRGKHGDHIGGEREAARALMRGDCDAACVIDGNHLLFAQEGVIPPGGTRTLVETPPYDHCNFTVLDGGPSDGIARFRELLLGMSYGDARVRRLLDLEGLKRWLPGRTSGYGLLSEAVDKFGFPDEFAAAAR